MLQPFLLSFPVSFTLFLLLFVLFYSFADSLFPVLLSPLRSFSLSLSSPPLLCSLPLARLFHRSDQFLFHLAASQDRVYPRRRVFFASPLDKQDYVFLKNSTGIFSFLSPRAFSTPATDFSFTAANTRVHWEQGEERSVMRFVETWICFWFRWKHAHRSPFAGRGEVPSFWKEFRVQGEMTTLINAG